MKIRCMVLCLSVALYLLCGRGPDIAGSGTLTTNGICIASHNGKISGYIYAVAPEDSLKETPTGAEPIAVRLFSSEYRPYSHNGFSVKLIPDSAGRFHCDTALSGNFTMLAYDTKDTVGVFFNDIPINDSVKGYIARKLFAPCGTIRGIIRDTSMIQSDCKGAYIIGTPFFELTDTIGAFSLLHIPAGSYTVRSDYFAKISDTSYQRMKGSLRTVDTLVIYTDSVKVDIGRDSLMRNVELSL